jgi:hypothetical protein
MAGNTRSVDRTIKSVVVALDPDFEHSKRNELEYKMSNGREFRGNPAERHPYNVEEDE